MVIENLFPLPIGMLKYEGKIDTNFLCNQEQVANDGNTNSKNKYILKHKQVLDLTQFIEKSLHEYFMATFNPKYDTRLKITQSWVNWTKPKQYHHKHSHPNSLISGCYYIKANKETDRIYFYKENYQQLRFPPVEWNAYNSDSWWFPVGTGDLILFPSSLTHMVHPVEGEETRISLAFNSFPIGVIGNEDELTALQLER